MCLRFLFSFGFSLFWIQMVISMSMLKNERSYFMDNFEPENDLANIIYSKSYMPDDRELPKISLIKKADEELIKLLNTQPKKNEYDLNDLVKIAFDSKSVYEDTFKHNEDQVRQHNILNENNNQNNKKLNFKARIEKDNDPIAVFRLENKEVDPYVKSDDSNYIAVKKLNNLLSNYQINSDIDSVDDDKKELLFDVLVSQLKTLCCKKKKPTNLSMMYNIITKHAQKMTREYIFLVVNDEIKNNVSDELISVDPDSLDRNSSVLLLGPVKTPLTDIQLKLVINRISNELSKPEYLPLLQQLSDGTLNYKNIKLSKSFVSGPETRRYIKPHRCNHQSKLAKIYSGPKWLLCTGYLNINVPSLYD
ncbi:uncharacterized protein LOC113522944 isoform X2 [Galleria mellonella]|uniref:Uncharacterized protein LOC113522944 isoform X2 n=1 Tax=Galleria mellonella TaxID=7137 RepID=A0A6J3CDM7_GALME|nr:uncharacterized protein LOC113522944 isoform X2 [Galleria mellonella]